MKKIKKPKKHWKMKHYKLKFNKNQDYLNVSLQHQSNFSIKKIVKRKFLNYYFNFQNKYSL